MCQPKRGRKMAKLSHARESRGGSCLTKNSAQEEKYGHLKICGTRLLPVNFCPSTGTISLPRMSRARHFLDDDAA